MSLGLAYRAGLVYMAGGLPGHDTQRLIRWNRTLSRWNGSHYRPVGDEEIKTAVTRWLARHSAVRSAGKRVQEVTESFIRDVMPAIKTEAKARPKLRLLQPRTRG